MSKIRMAEVCLPPKGCKNGDRNKPKISRNCKKDKNMAFLPNQIKESFVSLQNRKFKFYGL